MTLFRPYIRVSTLTPDDPKVRALHPLGRLLWYELMCRAAFGSPVGTWAGTPGDGFDADVVEAFRLGSDWCPTSSDLQIVTTSLDQMHRSGLIKLDRGRGRIVIVKWPKWQPHLPSDEPERIAARVRKHRAKKADCNAVTPLPVTGETDCNGLKRQEVEVEVDQNEIREQRTTTTTAAPKKPARRTSAAKEPDWFRPLTDNLVADWRIVHPEIEGGPHWDASDYSTLRKRMNGTPPERVRAAFAPFLADPSEFTNAHRLRVFAANLDRWLRDSAPKPAAKPGIYAHLYGRG